MKINVIPPHRPHYSYHSFIAKKEEKGFCFFSDEGITNIRLSATIYSSRHEPESTGKTETFIESS